jgi:tyrosyl-tRNA synthetase
MTSPYAFFQFWLNSDDKDVINFLKVFSFKSHEEILELEKSHNENPGLREAHRALGSRINFTSSLRRKTTQRVEAGARALFGQVNFQS